MSTPNITEKPVLVTGASGFIGSQLVSDLLARGYQVRGTVRSLAKKASYQHLLDLPGAKERLELVEADLLQPSAFDAVVAGCEYIHHTASPYSLTVKDPQRDLVDPAVKGTVGVLEAAARVGGVTRVVLTSSMAAITDEPESDQVLTEDDWNEKSSLERNPYYYSKTVAEREAWRFVKERSPGFDLIVINPFLVIGPSLTPTLNTSNQVFSDMLKGVFPGILSITWGMVDVRDVGLAHVLAMETPSASGRYICANTTINMRELVQLLRDNGYEGYKLPKMGMDCSTGDFIVRLSSYFQPKGVGQYLRTHIGRTPNFDHAKIRQGLGLGFRPLKESILETLLDLKRWGHLKSL